METAPRDGTIIEIKGQSGVKYRTRYLKTLGVWIDWDRQHVRLEGLRGWREWPVQFRQWTDEEEAILTMLHEEPE